MIRKMDRAQDIRDPVDGLNFSSGPLLELCKNDNTRWGKVDSSHRNGGLYAAA